ncbi:MAG: ABC transporter permease subunit [Verrucomicrobiota bacterium]
MQAYITLVRRELGSHFLSWTGYTVITAVVFLIGLSFVGMVEALNAEPLTVSITELFYETFSFWLILLMAAPMITMRTFALERHSGTFETLMTTPVSEMQVVLAKFSGALLFYLIMWLPLMALVFILKHYTQEPLSLDLGALATTYLGIALVGMLYLSLGCLASAMTRSQMIAAMLSFVVGISLFLLGFLSYAFAARAGWVALVLTHINMMDHLRDFARGVVDTRAVAFYLTGTFLFLYLTLKVVESRRWR